MNAPYQKMGSKISIDKHTYNIEEILEMNPAYFNKIKFETVREGNPKYRPDDQHFRK